VVEEPIGYDQLQLTVDLVRPSSPFYRREIETESLSSDVRVI
jgi:hypothetical protein